MQFLQPILLWGLLGISIPILIHLWRGKKGQVIHWAAMHWLTTQESSVAKGIRFENLLVLLLRVLMLVLLVLLLAKLFIPKFGTASKGQLVHLVQPNPQVTEEFKFELQQALEKGESIYWADGDLTALDELDQRPPEEGKFDLQKALNEVPDKTTGLRIYLRNSLETVGSGFYLSPVVPEFFLGGSEFGEKRLQQVSIGDKHFFEVNEKELLDSIPALDQQNGVDIGTDQLSYHLEEINDAEAIYIKSSLEAITAVYGIEFTESSNLDDAKLVFGNSLAKTDSTNQLLFASSDYSFSAQANRIGFPTALDFDNSELVRSGQLPQLILEDLLAFYGVRRMDVPVSKSQVSGRFILEQNKTKEKKANMNLVLLGLLLLCFGLERYFANLQGI